MRKLFLPFLEKGDEIRVVSPSLSYAYLWESAKSISFKNLTECGFKVTLSEHSGELDEMNSSSVKSRLDDLHTAFADKNVKAVLCAIGGFNSNQLLDDINYDLIRENPKIFCGYSDITALLNAIYAKTGLITINGPAYCNFGNVENPEHTINCFLSALTQGKFIMDAAGGNKLEAINNGFARGTIIGGNLCTLQLLQGTEYMPADDEIILFLEEDNIYGRYFHMEFERNLHSIMQVFRQRVKGIVMGSFPESDGMNIDTVRRIVKNVSMLKDIPVIMNADFGHIPTFSLFPTGGTSEISAGKDCCEIKITY